MCIRDRIWTVLLHNTHTYTVITHFPVAEKIMNMCTYLNAYSLPHTSVSVWKSKAVVVQPECPKVEDVLYF